MINIRMQPREVPKLSPKITVVGVGGAGGNAVNNMIQERLEGVEFLVCNTDAQALEGSLCENRIQLGAEVTGGLGAGSRPDMGRAAAEESLEEVMEYLSSDNMVFIAAGMGGGTGTGAAPVIARACREKGILTVGVVTKPFHFEGTHRMKLAEAGLDDMQQYVDTLIVIPNQNLFRVANEKTTFADAFRMADSVLRSGVRGVTDLIVRPGLINLDFADIRSAMMEMGKAMMGTGEASGERRAIESAEKAINNPLLDDVSMKGARGVIINVTGGYDMTLFEADEACNRIRDEVDPNANIIFGATFDESLDGVMRVSVVATGIEAATQQKAKPGSYSAKHTLERAQPNTQPAPQQQNAVTAMQSLRPAMPSPQAEVAYRPAPAVTMPVQAAAPVPAPVRVEEPETEMFEQQEFEAAAALAAAAETETAARAERYRDSFIPPRPVEPERYGNPYGGGYSYTGGFHGRQQPAETAQPSSAGLTLRPPVPGAHAQKRKTPSLFERITGQGRQDEDSHEDAPEAAEAAPGEDMLRATQRPAQGRLNIDAPSIKPTVAADDELDIPAFLRRQAN